VALLGPLAIGAMLGCTTGKAAPKPVAKIDTLPSGVVRVASSEPTGWSDTSRAWHFQEIARFGGSAVESTSGELIEPGTIGVDAQGRVYIADRKPPVVKVFDSTGALVRVIGREGSGPGEFRVAFIAVRNDVLVVHDPQQSRTSVFDTAGTYLRSWKSSCCYWDDIFLDREMRIYIPTPVPFEHGETPHRQPFTRYRIDGQVIDTLWTPIRDEGKSWTVSSKDGKMQLGTSIPFTPQIRKAFHPAGGFVYGWNGSYSMARSVGGPDTVRLIERSWEPETIPDSIRQAKTNETLKWVTAQFGEATAKAAIRVSDVPTQSPAYFDLRVDEDEYLWARRLVGSDTTKTRYDVFGPDGSWLGEVTVPLTTPEWGGMYLGRGSLYSATEDEDGSPVVVRLRIVR
jgi:hypothetical protein